jgi:SAM-dependent methyltransferase
MSDWYDDDAFWAAVEPALFPASRVESATEEMEAVLALAEPPAGGRALDLGCGPGRHAIALARGGYEVTGVDRTARYLERAKDAALAAGVEVELVRADMRAFEREARYDLAINMFSTFGYFSEEDNLRVARNVLASLKPGGAFVLEMLGKEILASGYHRRRWHPVEGGGFLLEDTRVTEGWERVENVWIFIGDDGQRLEHRFTHVVYSGVELRRLLWDAGFDEVELYGSLDGIPYDTEAERLVVVARKAAD